MLLADTTFLDVFWWMLVFFFWMMFFWIFISAVGDLFRRDDIGGWKKAGWLVFIVFLPFLGILIYMIVRPKVTAQAEAAQQAVAGVSSADELAKLAQLRSQGVISDEEFEALKRKALA
jgi:Short C-terminal domain/Phospholipase_D-nuclease N-terminal